MASSQWSSIFLVVRSIVFGIISVFSLIILGIEAHIAFALKQVGIVDDSNVLGLVVAVLTLLTLPPILAISIIRKGHIVNMIAIELAVMFVFWILWVVSASRDIDQILYCGFFFEASVVNCSEPVAVQALAWLNWILINKYIIITIVLTVLQHVRGNPIWNRPVNNVDLFAPRVLVVTPGAVYEQKTGGYVAQPYPIQPQQTGVYPAQQAPMGYPPTPGTNYTSGPLPQGAYVPSPPQQHTPVNTGYQV